MDGPLEIKDSTAGTEEPIKSEAPVQSPDSSDRSNGSASPPPNCTICLGKLINTSFTDSCLHQFCFTCLLQWSKIKTECPLCKQTFKSIIHNVRSEEDYDQYHVPRELAPQMPPSRAIATLELNFEVDRPDRRLAPEWHGIVADIRPEPEPMPDRLGLRLESSTNHRDNVYRFGIWATSLSDVYGRFRECSADYYRREPNELNRLIPWLNRELQVLLHNNPAHVAYVMRIILDALSQYNIRSPEFRDLVRPHFRMHTDHFVHEFLNYARSDYSLVRYDQLVTYLPQGLSNEYMPTAVSPAYSSNSMSSDDSDVRVLDKAIDLRVNTEIPSVGPHPINMPGPSTVGQAFQPNIPYNIAPDILTISSNTSSSDDDCEVIGYVKPRHERTPEIIELLSSDPEEIRSTHTPIQSVQPPASPFYAETFLPSTKRTSGTSSTETDSDSNSDYVCRRSRQYQDRRRKSSRRSTASKRRNHSIDTKTHSRGGRNLSSSGESEGRKRGGNRRCNQRSEKKRLPSSSDSSSQETDSKKSEDKRSRKGQYSAKSSTIRVRKDFIKREERYMEEDTSSSDSSSDSDEKNNRFRASRKSKKKYVASSSDFDTGRSGRVTRTKGKTKQILDNATMKDADRKEQRYKENRQSRSRSSSESSYASQKEKRMSSRRAECQRDTSEYGSHDDVNSVNKAPPRKEHEPTVRSRVKRVIRSSSDSDEGHFRSSSQCSNHSSKSYVHRKRSKHKEKHKSKERKRSTSRTFNSSKSVSSTTISVTATSSKADVHMTSSKHSDSKNNSSSKDRHKSHKSRKESKYRRSQGDTKSKSRKKRRCIASSTSSNSE